MSVTSSEKRAHRTPSLLVAAIPAVTLIVLLGGGYIAASLPVEPLLIASAVVAGIVAMTLGYTWDEIIGAIAEKIAKTMPAVLILIVVGALIGTWMAGGTIPMLIYYGLKIINPQFLALIALVVTAIVSLCTGTSWGSAGTIGVAFMGVAVGMDANLPMVAGAIVAGAYFGDKLSPLSDTTNIASLATGVNLFTHIRHLMWTTVPAFLTSAVVYLIFGLQSSGGTVPEKVGTILATLDSAFNWNLLLLVPVLVVLVGSVMKLPTVPVMLVSCATAMFNAVVFQGVSFSNSVVASVNGFKVDMVGKSGFQADSVIEDVTRLLERGGMNSMMSVLLICFCAIAFAGTVSVSGSLDVLISSLLAPVKSTFALIASTIVTGLAVIGITSNGQVSLLIPGEMLRGEYIKRGLDPKNLSRTIEDAATVWEPILPWTSAGAYMAGTLGVATLAYMPWAISNWIAIFFALVWAATGIGIAKLTPEELSFEAGFGKENFASVVSFPLGAIMQILVENSPILVNFSIYKSQKNQLERSMSALMSNPNNKDLFKKAGIEKPASTWEEFFQNCDKLKAAGITPLSMDTADSGWVTSLMLGAIVGQTEEGEKFMNTSLPKDYNQEYFVNAVSDIQKMFNEYTSTDAIGGAYENAAGNFFTEQTAIIANGPWMVGDFYDTDKVEEGFADKIGVAAFPGDVMYDAGKIGFNVAAKTEEKRKAAATFVKFMTNEDSQKANVEITGEIPCLKKEVATNVYPLVQETIHLANTAKRHINDFQSLWFANVVDEVSVEYPLLAQNKITAEEFAKKLSEAAQKNQ